MLPSTRSSWLKYSDDAYKFLNTYCHLIDFHANDYYTGALWERIDPTWRPYLVQATEEELHGCLAGRVPAGWPASLAAYLHSAQQLALTRQPAASGTLTQTAVLGVTAGRQTGSRRGGVNVKKQHEIQLLAGVIAQLATALGLCTVVDVGAGKGFLAQQLAEQHGLSVLAIDMSSSLVLHASQMARSREGQVQVTCSEAGTEVAGDTGSQGSSRSREGRGPAGGLAQQGQQGAGAEPAAAGVGGSAAAGRTGVVQVAAVAATLTAHNAVSVLQDALRQHQQRHGLAQVQNEQHQQQEQQAEPSASPSLDVQQGRGSGVHHNAQCREERVIVVGLHACGDLTPTLLRAFLAWPSAAAVVSLGCCYNLLTEAGGQQERMLASPAAAQSQGGGGVTPPSESPQGRSCTSSSQGRAGRSNAGGNGSSTSGISTEQRCAACCACCAAHRNQAAPASPTRGRGTLSCACSQHSAPGFPLSRHCSTGGFFLGGAARMAACHTNERLLAAGPQAAVEGAAQQVYRSLLNRYLQLYFADVPRSSLRLGRSRVKKKLARPAGMRVAATALQQQQRQQQSLNLGRSQCRASHGGGAVEGSGRGCNEAEGHSCPDAGDCGGSVSQEQEVQYSLVGAGQPTEAGFVQYMEKALLKLGLQQEAPGPEAAAKVWQEEGAAWAPLLPALCMLRQIAGPVIESLILADRALFLLEGRELQQEPVKDLAGVEEEQGEQQQQRCEQPQGEWQMQEPAGEEEQQQSCHPHQWHRQQDGVMAGSPTLARDCDGTAAGQGGESDIARWLSGLGDVHSTSSLHCMLVPLFSPVVSPRNIAIVAVKL